jgi:hypothetical protein
MYADKNYRFSFFLNERREIVYLIEQLGDDTTDYSKEEKPMTIYDYTNSRPDYVSNPLTTINVMIMISSLKERFGDKLHETARKGYLAIQDMSPYKYYKLCLWYWCDECTYGIRECTEEDFNIKEEDEMDVSKMSKEEALKAIENLKAVITLGIRAYELAQLMYCREYLKVDVKKLLEERKYGYYIFKLVYDITEYKYVIVKVSHYQEINERDLVWCFTDKDDAEKVRDYMNKYVAHVKRNMF